MPSALDLVEALAEPFGSTVATYLAAAALAAPVSPLVFRSVASCSASGVAVDARWCSTRPGVGSNGSQP